jgi:hypothetical protein
MLTIAPLLISFCALLIAGYGIIERRQETSREVRSRLVGVIGDLYDVNADLNRLAGPDPAAYETHAALLARTAMLAEQALILIDMLGEKEVTPEQYSSVAVAYHVLQDRALAVSLWEKAVKYSARYPDRCSAITKVACRRGLAWSRFETRDLTGARHAVKDALSYLSTDDAGYWEYVQTCIDWAMRDRDADPTSGDNWRQALAQGRAAAARLDDSQQRDAAVAQIDASEHALSLPLPPGYWYYFQLRPFVSSSPPFADVERVDGAHRGRTHHGSRSSR